MNHCCVFAVIVRYVNTGIELIHIVCPMRMTVEEKYILIILHKLTETGFVGSSRRERKIVFNSEIVYQIALAHIRVIAGSIEECVEEKEHLSVLVFFKLIFKPVKLFIGQNTACVFVIIPLILAKENKDISPALGRLINEIHAVFGNINNAVRLVLAVNARIDKLLPIFKAVFV